MIPVDTKITLPQGRTLTHRIVIVIDFATRALIKNTPQIESEQNSRLRWPGVQNNTAANEIPHF